MTGCFQAICRSRLLLMGATIVPLFAAAGSALAATGTISIYASGSFLIEERTSNITGPTHVPSGTVGKYTATFPNLSNSSGSLTALLGGTSGPDITCTTSFISTVVNGVCQVSVPNSGTGGASCTASHPVTNGKTCDFTVNVQDNARLGAGGGNPASGSAR